MYIHFQSFKFYLVILQRRDPDSITPSVYFILSFLASSDLMIKKYKFTCVNTVVTAELKNSEYSNYKQ